MEMKNRKALINDDDSLKFSLKVEYIFLVIIANCLNLSIKKVTTH